MFCLWLFPNAFHFLLFALFNITNFEVVSVRYERKRESRQIERDCYRCSHVNFFKKSKIKIDTKLIGHSKFWNKNGNIIFLKNHAFCYQTDILDFIEVIYISHIFVPKSWIWAFFFTFFHSRAPVTPKLYKMLLNQISTH